MPTLLSRTRATVILILLAIPAVLNGQVPCMGSNGLGNKGTLDINGIRNVKVNVPTIGTNAGQVNAGTDTAIRAGINAWNAKTGTTKVNLVPVYSGGDVSVLRDAAHVASTGYLCAVGYPGGDVYVDNYINDLGANPSSTNAVSGQTHSAILTYLFSHELGHVMNLDQTTNAGSIMDGLGSGADCNDVVSNNWPSTTTIQNADASSARDCASRLDEVPEADGAGQSEESGQCWDVYWVTLWFTMNAEGEWVYHSTNIQFLYTDCGENPYPS